MANNIFLIGFSGSGKSSVGKKLAKYLNYNFLDTDRIIEVEEAEECWETAVWNGELVIVGGTGIVGGEGGVHRWKDDPS